MNERKVENLRFEAVILVGFLDLDYRFSVFVVLVSCFLFVDDRDRS